MPMTTYRSFDIELPKDKDIRELLREARQKAGADLYVEEYKETYGFFRKKTHTYYSVLHPLGHGEYQILNIGRSKECIVAYLCGVLYNKG